MLADDILSVMEATTAAPARQNLAWQQAATHDVAGVPGSLKAHVLQSAAEGWR